MIKAALDEYAKTQNTVFAHDRLQTVGASEIGQCMRKTYYTKHVGPRDPDYADGWGARQRGTVFENSFWYPAMRAKFGNALRFAGPDQKTFISGWLSATPDGMLMGVEAGALAHLGVADIRGDNDSNVIMAECKTADPRTNLKEPKPENVFQVQVQMGIVRELTSYQPNYSVLSYTNASFWDEVAEFPIKFSPTVYQAAKDRATKIMTASGPADLKPEGWITGGRECELCPFTRACGITRRSVPADKDAREVDEQFVAEISDLANSIRRAEIFVGHDQEKLREMQQAMRDRLREKGLRRIPGVVTWSSVKGRKTYDNKRVQEAAKEAGIDIEQYVRVSEESDRLVIVLGKE